jgi:AAA+ superfamily predicted ATPase
MLEPKTKNLILSLVKQHSSLDDEFDDIISGKGMGLVGLFSGPPGCGKTLTAEVVSEITQRPLYIVSAGDLGVDPQKVDEKLTSILNMSHRWNAVLLLDEADVFLLKRNASDVNRNALVSIFLRQLEYFQGILILTTNRIEDCDPAFESRIHVTIHYEDLGKEARAQVWRTFLDRARGKNKTMEVTIDDADIERLAEKPINGRQVCIPWEAISL